MLKEQDVRCLRNKIEKRTSPDEDTQYPRLYTTDRTPISPSIWYRHNWPTSWAQPYNDEPKHTLKQSSLIYKTDNISPQLFQGTHSLQWQTSPAFFFSTKKAANKGYPTWYGHKSEHTYCKVHKFMQHDEVIRLRQPIWKYNQAHVSAR